MAQSKGLELIKALIQRSVSLKSYDYQCLKNVKVLSAGDGNIKAEFTVAEEHTNSAGALHGGCTTTLIDSISSFALMTDKTNNLPGVSVDLNISFLKKAVPGDVLTIDAQTIKAGRTLAFLKIEMAKKNDGSIIARGQHTKFIGF
ncbi:hypothetical protein HCN44_000959 [Aphidius gifuensis]|uniref:Acyl-coenzyme A thioesterase 13 n=1 Tax=Aphidius gifuensis TaxID=684658 RepID=A0A834XLW1_APHGI|nr:acyl-coenzyme A thioesterase 13-like [Aphidius gifuensis]KAF7988386.1 hypothetical protein HCN44_000959 [Aphidius gifuensis]